MEQTINWGIIGCGDVTEVKSGPAFNKVPHSRLVAVMRRNASKARDYAHRHGVNKWYSDADALINDPDINAIYVATPPLQHEDFAIRALRAGKSVYVEKPMAINTAAAKRMEEAARQTGGKISIAHYRRQQPLFLKIKDLIEQGAIGDIRIVNLQLFQPHHSDIIAQTEVDWRIDPAVSGGGLFYDLAPHQLDLLFYFFGYPQQAKGISFNAGKYYSADDITGGQAVFQNGILFNGTWCFISQARRDHCEMMGSDGSITFSMFDHQPVVVTHSNGEVNNHEFERLQHVQQPMIEKVVSFFLGQSPNPCPASEGVAVMELMDAFTRKKDFS